MKSIKIWFLFLGLLTMAGACGCGGGDMAADETGEEESSAMTEEENDTPANLQDAMAQVKDALDKAGMGQTSEPINFRELKKLLPEEISGMELTDQSGQTTGSMGFNISEATAEYTGDDGQRITLQIFDTGGIAAAAMGLAAWAHITIDKEDSNGYERTTTINGFKAFEKYNTNSQNGEISIFANDRIIVKAEGRKVEMEQLRDILDEIDFDELGGLE
jgi:hypothetical protein